MSKNPLMPPQDKIKEILRYIQRRLIARFPGKRLAMVLYGDYSTCKVNKASTFSVMVLTDASRNEIQAQLNSLRSLCAELLLEFDICASVKIENRDFFRLYCEKLEEYKNVLNTGSVYLQLNPGLVPEGKTLFD